VSAAAARCLCGQQADAEHLAGCLQEGLGDLGAISQRVHQDIDVTNVCLDGLCCLLDGELVGSRVSLVVANLQSVADCHDAQALLLRVVILWAQGVPASVSCLLMHWDECHDEGMVTSCGTSSGVSYTASMGYMCENSISEPSDSLRLSSNLPRRRLLSKMFSAGTCVPPHRYGSVATDGRLWHSALQPQ
jgi:hypothetical protein